MQHSTRSRCRHISKVANAFELQDGELFLKAVAAELYASLDTPVSLGCSILLKYGELEQLVGLKFDPSRYLECDVERAAYDYQAIGFLKKAPLEIKGVNRRDNAAKAFYAAEAQCLETNRRIVRMRDGSYVSPAVSAVLHIAQRKISRILGDFNCRSWALRCRFGPGSDNLTQGDRVTGYHKLTTGLSCTSDFLDGARALVQSHPSWERAYSGLLPDEEGPIDNRIPFTLAHGNKVTFVPKDALKDRVIAIEPRINIFAQLGLGKLIRSRMKRFQDLDTQLPSQEAARLGSLLGTVATIDLSMASDTLALELVRELIPPNWFAPMDWCRSKTGLLDGKTIYYQKFSSMGNGFTFELESLIFWALAVSVCSHLGLDSSAVRSYGDDIAIPTRATTLLYEVLAFCGFSVNRQKSFDSGGFRESCGSDYLYGVNVRPFFQKEIPRYAASLYNLANGLRRASMRRCSHYGCDRRYRHVWITVVCRLPKPCRALLGPDLIGESAGWDSLGAGDGHLICNLDEASASPFVRRAAGGWEGWLYATLVPEPRKEVVQGGPDIWAYALYSGRDGVGEKPSGEKVSLRGGRRRRLQVRAFSPAWRYLGPWL